MIKYLSKQIEKVEKEMDSIVKSNERLKSQYNLITGITSIGTQTALFIIAFTAGFTKFKNSRKFAAYCGIAPFPNTSGSSFKRKSQGKSFGKQKNKKSIGSMCKKRGYS